MRLTERDLDLLSYLGSQGVASGKQLSERFFPSHESFQVRISKLKRQGLIETVPLTALKEISLNSFRQAMTVMGVPSDGLWKYRIYRLGQRFRKNWNSVEAISDVRMWKHQMLLNEIRTLCESLFPNALILSDPDIRHEWRRFRAGADAVIPDLVIRDGKLEVAIEVERHTKSERDYFQRFLAYRDSAYTHVIYFCETERVFSKVAAEAARIQKIAVTSIVKKSIVYRESTGYQPIEAFLGIAA